MIFRLIGCFICTTMMVDAQVSVFRGSVHKYEVQSVVENTDYLYVWKTTGGTVSSFGSKQVTSDILWSGPPGIYAVSVFPLDKKTGCAGNTQTFSVKLIDFFVKWKEQQLTVCSTEDQMQTDQKITAEFSLVDFPWIMECLIDGETVFFQEVTKGASQDFLLNNYIKDEKEVAKNHDVRIVRVYLSNGLQLEYNGDEPDAEDHVCHITILPTQSSGKLEFVRKL